MPRRYPTAFRRKVLDLVEAGRPVAKVVAQLGGSVQTIYNWRNQDLVDRGLRPGVITAESAELAAARHGIRELGCEFQVTRWISQGPRRRPGATSMNPTARS